MDVSLRLRFTLFSTLFQHRACPKPKKQTSPFVQLQLPASAELHLLFVFGFQPRTKTWISGFSGFRHWKKILNDMNAWIKPHLIGFGLKSGSYILELNHMVWRTLLTAWQHHKPLAPETRMVLLQLFLLFQLLQFSLRVAWPQWGSVKMPNGCGTTRCTSVQIRHLWHLLQEWWFGKETL